MTGGVVGGAGDKQMTGGVDGGAGDEQMTGEWLRGADDRGSGWGGEQVMSR